MNLFSKLRNILEDKLLLKLTGIHVHACLNLANFFRTAGISIEFDAGGKELRREIRSEPHNNLYAKYTHIFVRGCQKFFFLKKVQESRYIYTAAVKYVTAENRFSVKQV
jgi:hypothetical protein